MQDEVIVRQCSPTLAGLKTGNLFSVDYSSEDEMREILKNLNNRLSFKGLRAVPVRYGKRKALIYLYRPEKLRQDLMDSEANRLLCERGYCTDCPEKCVAKLIEKVRTNSEFPHEIGLFLSYPPEDVRGFIENKANNYKCVGTWKVYGDEEAARKTFCRYEKCTNCFYRQFCKGMSIERLTVAV